MSTILDYDEPHGRILPFRNDLAPPRALMTLEEARAIIACSPAHARAVAEGRSRRIDVSEPSDAATGLHSTPGPIIAVAKDGHLLRSGAPLSDVCGNPVEVRCPKSQLANILAVRDEQEAAEARRTVRPIADQAECPNCRLPEDECFCADENDFHGDEGK